MLRLNLKKKMQINIRKEEINEYLQRNFTNVKAPYSF